MKELNERFGDWYYVISNDVFEKVHLGREDVIREKKAEGATEAAPGRPPGSPLRTGHRDPRIARGAHGTG